MHNILELSSIKPLHFSVFWKVIFGFWVVILSGCYYTALTCVSYLSDCWEITCLCVKARQKLILLVAMVSSESSDSQSLRCGGNVIFTVEWRGCCPGPKLVLMEATEDRLWASWTPKAEKVTLHFYLYGEAHKGYVSPLRALEYQRLCAEKSI